MTHTDKSGCHKVVRESTYSLTAAVCVDRVYTNLAVIDVEADGLCMVDLAPDADADVM